MYQEYFENIIKTEDQWLLEKRKKSFDLFNKLNMPSEREEPWRYTDISKLNLKDFKKNEGNIEIEKINNENVIFCDIETALKKHSELIKPYFTLNATDKISAMQLSLWKKGIFIYVPENIEISLKAVFNTGSYYTIIVANKGSKLNFYEKFIGDPEESSINTSVTEVFAKENSEINFYSLQNFSNKVHDFSMKNGIVEKNATINWLVGNFGGKLTRSFIETFFVGENSKSKNLSLYMGGKNQHIDITNNAYHRTTGSKNNMLSKGILKGSSTSVYKGLIKIEENSKETDTYLASNSLVIGEKANSNPIPKLEINTNDITKAGHGASVGYIDEDKLFYMMSRGMNRKQAEKLIISGFFDPILKTIQLDDAKKDFEKVVQEKMIDI